MRSTADYGEYLRKCIRCSFCQPVCPLFAELRVEGVLARAKVRLAKDFSAGKLKPSPRLKELFGLCLDCRACEAVCPAHVPTHEIVQEMRDKLEPVPGPDQRLYKIASAVLSRPRLTDSLAAAFIRTHRGLARVGAFALAKRFIPLARQAGAVFPPPAKLPFLKQVTKREQRAPMGQKKVGYFVGCATNYLFPATAQAVEKALRRNGYPVLIPTTSVCCGLPLFNAGKHQASRRLASQVIEQFRQLDPDVVVTDCAGCSLHLREYGQLWPDLPGAVEFSAKVRDVCAFAVAEALQAGPQPVSIKVTYHDPCHLGRAQGIVAEPRRVMSEIKGLELVEMAESDRCCGGSGLFSLTHPELSDRILARKLDNILQTGTGFVATSCPACRIQLERGIKTQVVEQVIHPLELLAQTWGQEEE
jgi:glycolate oxidase iron-sulfur subunit